MAALGPALFSGYVRQRLDMDYKLYAVRVFISDFDRALEFYTQKLGMRATYVDPALGWVQFDTGGASLALERIEKDDPEAPELLGRFVGVSLTVDDVSAAYDELSTKGVEFEGLPEKQPWGGTLAHFKDPDGNVLTLLS